MEEPKMSLKAWSEIGDDGGVEAGDDKGAQTSPEVWLDASDKVQIPPGAGQEIGARFRDPLGFGDVDPEIS